MEENKSPVGPIIGTIIIIALIVLGGLYFWGKRVEDTKSIRDLTSGSLEATTTTDQSSAEAAAIKSTSSSDDVDSIQNDLSNTNTTNLSPELNAPVQQ